MGLRGKIALALAGTAVLVAAVIGVLVHFRTAAVQLDAARSALDDRFVSLLDRHLEGQDAGLAEGAAGVPPALVRAVTAQPVRVTYLDGPTLWAATRVEGQVVSLSRSYAAEREELAALDQILAGSGLAAAVVGSLVGLVVAGGLSRRIRTVARTATAVADGDLTARVFSGPSARWDEVVAVGMALDRMADALQARLEAERRVTADIAHELRTPVAGLVTAAELLPPGRPTELVRDRAAVLRRLVEDVLEVARLDAEAEEPALEARPVSALAKRAIAAGHVGVSLVVERDAVVETDPRRVERILVNLIGNALRHGTAPVTVTVDGAIVTVADHGPGFPDELLAGLREYGPQRFASGATARGVGVGLGLTIAAGQARVLGADLEFDNSESGAIVTLRLP